MLNPSTNSLYLLEDHLSRGGPDEWLGIGVMVLDVVHDGFFKFPHGIERTTANVLVGDLGEPELDLIEPGTAGGDEVQVEARMSD